MKTILETEVCVIGGGPAGTVTAMRLAEMGHKVMLVTKEKSLRRNYESISSGAIQLLEFAGLKEILYKLNVQVVENLVSNWHDNISSQHKEVIQPSYIISRYELDNILLDATKVLGITIHENTTAGLPIHDGNTWTIPIKQEGKSKFIKARYLVNAAGRHKLFPGKRPRQGATTQAFYASWENTRFDPTTMLLEAAENHWIWGAPTADKSFHICVFTSSKYRALKKEQSLHNFYHSIIANSALLASIEGEMIDEVAVCDATQYYCSDAISKTCLQVGDALMTVDPLSSQGIVQAISSAIKASVAIHTILTKPENTPAAIAFYENFQTETIANHSRIASLYYSKPAVQFNNDFWNQRSQLISTAAQPNEPKLKQLPLLTDGIRVSPDAQMVRIPCIEGNIVCFDLGLSHINLSRPIVYYGNIKIASLLNAISAITTPEKLLQQWNKTIPDSKGIDILSWLWNHEILVEV